MISLLASGYKCYLSQLLDKTVCKRKYICETTSVRFHAEGQQRRLIIEIVCFLYIMVGITTEFIEYDPTIFQFIFVVDTTVS